MNQAWHDQMAAVDADIDHRERLTSPRSGASIAHLGALVVIWYVVLAAVVWWITTVY